MPKTLEQRAAAVVEQMVDLPDDKRPAAVAAACGGDGMLLNRVQSLLSALPAVDGFLDATADGDAVAGLAPIGEKSGDKIGRYKLLEKIGEGGFGVVFTAEQTQPVRRLVAIKVIKMGMDTREVVSRFEAERQALALMDHPNIARVLDAGSTESGRPYFVMELVRGSTVTDYADKHRLSTKDRVALAAQICRAVQHAHSKGVIHRDLKPSNVLVTVTDDKPVPKVIDFGIAKATQGRLSDQTLYTAHRQLIGTPQYMSPEQADSDGSDIDTRTDVYSLGVLLYELLVGTTPFDAKHLRSAAYEAMRKMIRDTDVPRPATRLNTLANDAQSVIAASRSTDVKKLTEQVKGELDWIIMKALEKDRTRRYDTASALADDLNRYLAGDAVLAGPVSGAYRLKKTLKRYKAAAIIGSAIAACLLLGVAGTTWGLIQARHQRAIAVDNEHRALTGEQEARHQEGIAAAEKKDAVAQKVTAEQKTAEAKATLEFFTGLLAKASPNETKDAKVSQVLVDKLIKPALATIDSQFKEQPLVRASIQNTLARTLHGLGRYDLAEQQAKAAYDARQHLLPADHPDTLAALGGYASAINAQGRYAEAERLDKQLWDAQRRVQGDDHPATLSALNNYAGAIEEQARHAEAELLLKQCWEACRRVLGDDHPDTLTALGNYAEAIKAQGRHAEAEPLLKQLWDAHRRKLGDDHPQTLIALNNYAQAINDQGRHAEAEPLLKQLWDAQRRVQGDDHPDTLRALNNYANAIHALGRHAEAERLDKQLWDAQRRVQGDDHPDTLRALNNYAEAIDARGRHAEAEPLLKQLWDAHRRMQGDDHPDTLSALNNYALAIDAQGRHDEAERLDKQLWDAQRRVQGDDHPDTVRALNNYAEAIDAQGRHAEAEPLLKQCWDARRRKLGDDHPDTLLALNNYAFAIDAQGRHDEAERLFKQCWDAQRRVLGDDHPDTLRVLNNYALAIGAQGRHAEAERLAKQLWDAERRVQGDDHPDTLRALDNYAEAINAQGRHAEAEPLLKQIWVGERRVQRDDHPETLMALCNYALAIDAQGRHAEAEPLLKQCWDARRRVLGDDHPDTLQALDNYAVDIEAQGHHAQAAPLFKQLWETRRRKLGDDHSDTRWALTTYGKVLFEDKQFADAERLFRQELERLRGLSPQDELQEANAESGLGRCLAHMGPTHATEAESLLREAIAIRSKRLGPNSGTTKLSAGALADLLDVEHHPEEAAKVRADAGLNPTTAVTTK